MKKINVLIFCFSAIVLLGSGCKALYAALNKPRSKRVKRTPKKYEPTVLPDGSTIGLNKYEMKYVKDINKEFKRQQQEDSSKIFGGPKPR